MGNLSINLWMDNVSFLLMISHWSCCCCCNNPAFVKCQKWRKKIPTMFLWWNLRSQTDVNIFYEQIRFVKIMLLRKMIRIFPSIGALESNWMENLNVGESVFFYNKCWTNRPNKQLDHYLMWKLDKLMNIFFLCLNFSFIEHKSLKFCSLFTINWHSWRSTWWVDPESD